MFQAQHSQGSCLQKLRVLVRMFLLQEGLRQAAAHR